MNTFILILMVLLLAFVVFTVVFYGFYCLFSVFYEDIDRIIVKFLDKIISIGRKVSHDKRKKSA